MFGTASMLEIHREGVSSVASGMIIICFSCTFTGACMGEALLPRENNDITVRLHLSYALNLAPVHRSDVCRIFLWQ